LFILPDKIDKAKSIVEAGKNISALKEENESLREQLKSNLAAHSRVVNAVEDAANAEIESLKKSLAE
jgi:hypothetical protein